MAKIRRTHCVQGHARIPENIDSSGCCKTCKYERSRARRLENPEAYNAYQRDWDDKNRARKAERSKAYRKANPERFRNTRLKSRYKITELDRLQMLKDQGNCCKICGVDFGEVGFHEARKDRNSPVVDHDHTTNIVRGILCRGCNLGIGGLRDTPQFCLNAAAYLQNSRAVRL